MNADKYQEQAKRTVRINWESTHGPDVAVLGVIGELGSLASVLKKHQRDGLAYAAYQDHLIEEVGDILWYVVSIASRMKIRLDRWPDDKACQTDLFKLMYTLSSLVISLSERREEICVGSESENSQPIYDCIWNILNLLQEIANAGGSSLSHIAELSCQKILSYWGKQEDIPARCFDRGFPEYERLPRKFEVEFLAVNNGTTLIMRMDGVAIGDRLTDNAYEDDGYRFHDVFHIAGVATLGWSPVFRRILKLKRKSDNKKDEIEDGARAAIIEEAVINHIYDYARETRNFLEGMSRVDLDLIKRIQKLVRGCEVKDCEPWEWQDCILKSYAVFRELKAQGGGVLEIDADKRSIKLRQEKAFLA